MINKYKIYEKLPIIMLLGATTGWVDALTFQYHNERFAAFQTGNIIQVGINLANSNWSSVMTYFLPIIFFILGTGLNYLIKKFWHGAKIQWQQVSLLIQAIGILIATIFEKQISSDLFIAALAMLMAFQADTFVKLNDMTIATAFSTGNLKNFSNNLTAAIVNKDRLAFKNAIKILLVIISFGLGAVASIMIAKSLNHWAMIGASVLLLIILIAISFENRKNYKKI